MYAMFLLSHMMDHKAVTLETELLCAPTSHSRRFEGLTLNAKRGRLSSPASPHAGATEYSLSHPVPALVNGIFNIYVYLINKMVP